MRVISAFKDYYDVGLSLGVDTNLVYVRDNQITRSVPSYLMELLGTIPKRKHYSIRVDNSILLYRYLVGFCGRVYRFYGLKYSTPIKYCTEWAYSLEDLLRVASMSRVGEGPNSSLNKLLSTKPSKGYSWGLPFNRATITQALSGPFRIDDSVFHDLGVPIFLVTDDPQYGKEIPSPEAYLSLNPSLSEVAFYRVLDSYTAFQEVSMYLGGVLGQGAREIVTITDDTILRNSKGFDEYSFKTASPGKKPRGKGKK